MLDEERGVVGGVVEQSELPRAVVGEAVGQRRRGGAASAPLADGLADDRAWKLGLFYYAPDDPSFFVEHRFGLGYTINLGNRWAVGALAGYLLFIAAVLVVAFASTD